MGHGTIMNANRWHLLFAMILLGLPVTFVTAMWLDCTLCDVILVSQSAVIVVWAVLMSFLGLPRWRTFWSGMAVFAVSFACINGGSEGTLSTYSHFSSRGLANAYTQAFHAPRKAEQPLVINRIERSRQFHSFSGPTPILSRNENAYAFASYRLGRFAWDYESELDHFSRRIHRRMSAMLTILIGLAGGGLSSWLFRRDVGRQPTL